jgi:hypothetical protein
MFLLQEQQQISGYKQLVLKAIVVSDKLFKTSSLKVFNLL